MSSKIIRAESPDLDRVLRFEFSSLQSEGAVAVEEAPPSAGMPQEAWAAASGAPEELQLPGATASQTPAVADQQAELILREARVKAAEIEKAAYAQGFSEGEKAGRETGENLVGAVLKQYAGTLDELKELRRTILTGSEREVVRLSLEIARKVVKREVAVDEELILALVKVALSRLADQTLITVRLNPKDCQSILNHRPTPANRDSLAEGIRLLEDPMITRGGCLIETESGVIDARVEEQFREIEKGFFE